MSLQPASLFAAPNILYSSGAGSQPLQFFFPTTHMKQPWPPCRALWGTADGFLDKQLTFCSHPCPVLTSPGLRRLPLVLLQGSHVALTFQGENFPWSLTEIDVSSTKPNHSCGGFKESSAASLCPADICRLFLSVSHSGQPGDFYCLLPFLPDLLSFDAQSLGTESQISCVCATPSPPLLQQTEAKVICCS